MSVDKPKKSIPEHKDKLGRIIQVNDCVCYPDGNHLEFGRVDKLNPKMIGIIELPQGKYGPRRSNKYPDDVVIVTGPEATMFLIKNSG